MSPHLCHVHITLSCLLLLGLLGLGYSASLGQLRIQRDTRNIPSNMFKPLGSSGDSDQNETAVVGSDFTFSERSTGEAKSFDRGSSQDDDFEDRNSGRSWPANPGVTNRFSIPTRNKGFSSNPYDDYLSSQRDSFRQRTNLNSSGFPNYAPMPLSIQTRPANGFSQFGSPGFSNNNYYRSESYSVTSDGMGAPQIQQSVFDSRLGHGMNNLNF